MTIHSIENLTFEELEAQKPKLLEALKAAAHEELAARYLQARTDAKQRDEKLAEQAKTLATLKEREAAACRSATDAMGVMQSEADAFRKEADAAIRELKEAAELHNENFAVLESSNAELIERMTGVIKQRDRLRIQANSATEAMTTVQAEALSAISVIQKAVTDVLRHDAAEGE